jgi:hypothetical protein
MRRPALVVLLTLAACQNDVGTGAARSDKQVKELRQRSDELARRVAVLEAEGKELENRAKCLEAQRAMKAAWVSHYEAVAPVANFDCGLARGSCPPTGLPPLTYTHYDQRVFQVIIAGDKSRDALREVRAELPPLPVPKTKLAQVSEMEITLDEAQKATEAYLAACAPELDLGG